MKKRRCCRIFLSLFVFCLLCNGLTGQKSDRKMNWQHFRRLVTKIMEDWHVPGLGMIVVKDGKIVFAEGFGLRDVKRGLKVTPQTLFPIASCTKTFTAVSLAILVDEGKADWDAPLKDLLPSFRLCDVYASDHMTLRDLLAHRSGLPQHYRMYFNRTITRKEIFERLPFLELSKGLREGFQYSNLNYTIAAFVLEQLTRMTWEEFVQRRIFDPLEMSHSNFSVIESQKASDFALPYRIEDGELKEIPFFDVNPMGMGPAGSINSNLADMAHWLLLHLSKGKYNGRQIVSESNLAVTHTPQIVLPGVVTDELFYSSYGMGWVIDSYRNHLMLSHGGGFDGFSCYVSILPRDNIGCAVFCNLEGVPVTRILTRIVYDRLLGLSEIPWNQRMKESFSKSKPAVPEKTESTASGTKGCRNLEDYCGEFSHPAYGILSIKLEDDHLYVVHNGLTSILAHVFHDVFETKDRVFGRFRFLFISDMTGTVNAVEVPFEPSVKNIVFRRIRTVEEEKN